MPLFPGSAGDEYYNLESVLQATPEVAAITRITGYLSENSLDDHVAAADLMINMRFPSVGESSGSLARALASGVCALVTETGGYAEYPSDTVLKIGPLDTAETLTALIKAACNDEALRKQLGTNAKEFADNELSMSKYIDRFLISVDKAKRSTPPATHQETTAPNPWIGPIEHMKDEFNLIGDNTANTQVEFAQNIPEIGSGIFVRRRS